MFTMPYHHFEKHSRLFGKGDLKYVILDLLKDRSAHGYEIMRALEDRFHGFYSPSAGSVYPTLQLLEDMGYVRSSEQDGKKVYTITEDGKRFLQDREDTVSRIKGHMRDWWGTDNREEFRQIFQEFKDTARDIARAGRRIDKDRLIKIREIVRQTARDIGAVLKD